MRVVNWNIERRAPHTWQAKSLVAEMAGLSPDIIMLTEAHASSLDSLGGYAISHEGYRAGKKKQAERLALLWSAAPLTRLPVPRAIEQTGGAVLGVTRVAGRDVKCLSLCIPYHMAKLDHEDRTRPWHHHDAFLTLIAPWLPTLIGDLPLIVAGDFNRRMPSKWGPKRSYALLQDAFAPLTVHTRGSLSPLDELTIDHVATCHALQAKRVEARSRFGPDGRARSDHFGVLVDF